MSTRRCCGLQGGGHFKKQSSNSVRDEVSRYLPQLEVLILTIKGIYAPGYEERRRERIKQNYGIDVPRDPS